MSGSTKESLAMEPTWEPNRAAMNESLAMEPPPPMVLPSNEEPNAGLLGGGGKQAFTGSREYVACVISQIVAAVVLIIATAIRDEDTDNWAYALAVGSVALIIALASLMILPLPSITDRVVYVAPRLGEITVTSMLAIFLLPWWGVGMGILTFYGPFVSTTNGYFAVRPAASAVVCSSLRLSMSNLAFTYSHSLPAWKLSPLLRRPSHTGLGGLLCQPSGCSLLAERAEGIFFLMLNEPPWPCHLCLYRWR